MEKMNKCFFCKRGENCVREICSFAHSFEELNPTICKWGDECKRRNCTYKHSIETKEEYAMRLFKEDLRRMEIFLPEVMDACHVGTIAVIEKYVRSHPKLKDMELTYNKFDDEDDDDISRLSWGDLDEYYIQKDIETIRDLLHTSSE
jgi:hypothetical protein